MNGTVLAGYDGTDGGRAALEEAARLASDLGARLVIAFAYEPDRSGGESADLRDALQDVGKQRLAEGGELAREWGVDAETVLIDDRPAEGLADYAERTGARMIVVGSYGKAPLRSAILGSTPHRLLHLATVPVLVVRA